MPMRIKLGTASHHENGCHSSSQHFTFGVPNIDGLDHSYNDGPLAGIEVQVTNKNNDAGYTNFQFIPDHKAISFDLFAHGKGSWVNAPWGGGGVCVGAEGAWISIDVYGHYK